ncbi:O-antigen ligase family protein [Rhodococcus sp. AG1013]|uniref:O-antigen ligase family protein n=1 Tax=Rhodococcus sp. AG1013 TaxID=2183996 RepID=UPI0011C05D33|nr:O-antigen ligase family protein [Rhodococcus sp. AG1013]
MDIRSGDRPAEPTIGPGVDDTRPAVRWVGLLLGVAAAVPGVPALVPVLGIRPWHMLVAVAILVACTQAASAAVPRLRITSLDIVVLLYTLASVLAEYTNSGDLGYGFDLVGAVTPLFYLVGYIAARLVIDSRQSARAFLTSFAVPAIPAGILSVLQLGSPAFSLMVLKIAPGPGLSERIVDGRLIRATGLVGHWTGLGFYFCTALAACCSAVLLAERGQRRFTLPLAAALFASAFGALASLTLSVLATVAVIVLVTLFVMGIRISRVVGLGAVVLLGYMQFGSYLDERFTQQTAYRPEYLPGWVPNTIAYRWKIWTQQTIPAIEDRFWTGWGSSVYTGHWRPSQLVWGSPESQWFGTAVASGVIVAVLLGLTLLVALRYVLRGTAERRARWKLPIGALVVSALVASLTVPAFTNRGLPIGLWVLFGVVLALEFAADSGGTADRGGTHPTTVSECGKESCQ